jgi:hypothetical protein
MTKIVLTLGILAVLSVMIPLAVSAFAETEDDGYVYPDNATPDEKHEQDKQEKQMWKDAGKPGDDNNDHKSKSNDNDLPRCKYLVVRDCVLNDIGQTCIVGTDEDACQDIFYGYNDPNYKPGEKIQDNRQQRQQ